MRFRGDNPERRGGWHVRICGSSTRILRIMRIIRLFPAASEDSHSSGTAEAGSHDGHVLEGIDVVI